MVFESSSSAHLRINLSFVCVGFALLHREDGIQQQHALVRPRLQISMLWGFESFNICLKLFVHVLETRWSCTWVSGFSQPSRLTWYPLLHAETKTWNLHKLRIVTYECIPCACLGPWYGSCPRITTWIQSAFYGSKQEHLDVANATRPGPAENVFGCSQ